MQSLLTVTHLTANVVHYRLTGAMKPLGLDGRDGLQSLAEALLAARLLKSAIYGVRHGQVFTPPKRRKAFRVS
jgi:hypothetical protein